MLTLNGILNCMMFLIVCRKMREAQERLKKLLRDTLSMLCRNSVQFQHSILIEGVIGITVDDDDVFLVHINDTISSSHDTVPQNTSATRGLNIKSEPEYAESTSTQMLRPAVHDLPMPYSGSSSASAAAGSGHVSSTVVTQSFVIKADNAVDSNEWGGATYDDSYSDLAYPLMHTDSDMGFADTFQQPLSAVQYHSKPKMQVYHHHYCASFHAVGRERWLCTRNNH